MPVAVVDGAVPGAVDSAELPAGWLDCAAGTAVAAGLAGSAPVCSQVAIGGTRLKRSAKKAIASRRATLAASPNAPFSVSSKKPKSREFALP